MVKNKNHELPIKHLEESRIAVVTLGDEQGTSTMFQRQCAMYAATTRFSYNAGDNLSKLEAELRKGNFNKVIVGVHSNSAAYYNALASLVNNAENVSVAMFINPYKIQNYAYSIKHCKSIVVAYDNDTRILPHKPFLAATLQGVLCRLPSKTWHMPAPEYSSKPHDWDLRRPTRWGCAPTC